MKYFVILLAMIVSTYTFASEKYFECEANTPNSGKKIYSLALNEEEKKLYLNEGSQNLKIHRLNSTQIWASNTVKIYRGFEYDHFTFYINRITGSVEVSYSTEPSKEHIEQCKLSSKSENSWCEAYPVLTEQTENGICKVVPRKL